MTPLLCDGAAGEISSAPPPLARASGQSNTFACRRVVTHAMYQRGDRADFARGGGCWPATTNEVEDATRRCNAHCSTPRYAATQRYSILMEQSFRMSVTSACCVRTNLPKISRPVFVRPPSICRLVLPMVLQYAKSRYSFQELPGWHLHAHYSGSPLYQLCVTKHASCSEQQQQRWQRSQPGATAHPM